MNPARSTSGLRWAALGMLVLQIGWILALPPFRGIDEFDHVYRADAVAHGEWVAPPTAATRGTGALVTVSEPVAEAARPECERLNYTGPEDCVGNPAGDRVELASGAGRYNPLYYALVGYPAALFDGVASLYAMRVVSALACLGLLWWSLSLLRRWAGPRVLLATAVGMTPMVVYSTTVVAPNGLEMIAGLGFWVALGGLAHDPDRRTEVSHLALAVASGGLLVTLRSRGPLWAVLVLVTALVAWPTLRQRLPVLLRQRRGQVAAGLGLLLSAASVAWILSQRSLVIGTEEVHRSYSVGERVGTAASEIPLWLLQTIAAFPLRNEPAPMFVYVCFAVLLGVLVLGALVLATRSARWALTAGVVLSFALPLAITAVTLSTFGTAWQGRYALPYLIGTALVAGLVWAARRHSPGWRVLGPFVALLVAAQVAGPVAVLRSELVHSPLAGTASWALAPPWWALAGVVTVGAAAFALPLAAAVNKEASR